MKNIITAKNIIVTLFLLGLANNLARAQSEAFNNPEKTMNVTCFHQGQVISKLISMKESGMSLEEFQARNPIPRDWSVNMRTDAAHAMANVWSLDNKAVRTWANEVMQRCLTSKENHGSASD